MVGYAEAEGIDREGRSTSGVEEEDEAVAQSYYETVLSGKLSQAIRWSTNREGVGYLLPDNQCTKTGRPVAEVLREKHPDMRVPTVENSMCSVFKEYEEVPETVILDFAEDYVMWVISKLSDAADALGAEAIEKKIWLLHFGCA